ncbi:MAG: ribonuclease HIII [Verrucomicrobia bacterium]|jgi:ribonuclease HIII|nr:ribonuclease HIII [Verrucomicrobiota bacterium]|tara:strand:+ start:43523 stop:44440 length:918 start_codon:yes stop_codon:yes gene_type:complete
MTSHTAPLTPAQVAKLRSILEGKGFEFVAKQYTIFAAKKGKLNISVYKKGPKVLIQGKDTEDFIRFTFEPEITGVAKLGYEEETDDTGHYLPHFGIDESGKGDFFGPLVVAGVYTDAEITRLLVKGGIMDSKRITTPAAIRKLAAIIKATPGIEFDVIAIRPERYNEIYGSFKNLNRMLAWGHATVIEELAKKVPNCPRALSDQFARADVLQSALKNKDITLKLDQRTKGESDTAVAAASILARERFIDWMDAATKKVGFTIPLGASSLVIDAGKKLVATHGKEVLGKFAKLHFKTTQQVVGELF